MFPIRIPKHHTTLSIAAVWLGIAFALPTPGTAGIITVTATAGPGLPSLLDSSGSAIPAGNHLEVGFFPANYDFSTKPGDVKTLMRNWTSFGSLEVMPIFNQDGRFSGDLAKNDTLNEISFAGEQIYLFAFLTPEGEAPSSSPMNVSDFGIFTNNSSTAWKFPDSNSGTPFTMVSTADATTRIDGGGIQLTGVPEPSTAGVCGVILGTSILFARRRSPRRRVPTPTHRMPAP